MPLVRATPLKDFRITALSTTGVGSAYSTAPPVSGEDVYGGLHLLTVSTARTLRMTIQAASSSGFSPLTTELIFSLTSEAAATWLSAASPSTDRPWRRASWTLSTVGLTTGGTWTGLVWTGFHT